MQRASPCSDLPADERALIDAIAIRLFEMGPDRLADFLIVFAEACDDRSELAQKIAEVERRSERS